MRRIGAISLLIAAILTMQAAVPGDANKLQAQAASMDSTHSNPAQSAESAAASITVLLNGQPAKLSTAPIMKQGSVYVPLRSLLTALGAEVDWDAATGDVTTTHNEQSITIRSGSDQAVVNGKPITLDRPPFQSGGITYVSVRWLNEAFGAAVKWQGSTRTVSVYYPDEQLPAVGSFEHLQSLLADASNRSPYSYIRANLLAMPTADAVMESTATANKTSTTSASTDAGGSDYSATNVQVEGVDEADVVKTDGTYIYQVNRQRILISSARPADQMKTIATLRYADGSFSPQELYVDEEHLIVIGSGSPSHLYPSTPMPMDGAAKKMIMPIMPAIQTTVAIIYDISDIASPREIRRLELEGSYLSSRKIGDSLYLISNKYLDVYGIIPYRNGQESGSSEIDESSYQPKFRDSAVHEQLTTIAYDDIRYFPGFIEPNYMLVAGVDLSSADEPMHVETFLGSGHNVYASTEHLYVAVTKIDQPEAAPAQTGEATEQESGQASDQTSNLVIIGTTAPYQQNTAIYKFSLHAGDVIYMAEGSVNGTILNQFSMDEHEGHFRIATTSGEQWGVNELKNNLYVLGDALQPVGKIEDIAPGERIYSVRFAGDRAYMVTFRTVDPLFVIDVANPSAPTILGELKIPGYSDYLHPYDENHIIGFGKDTIEVSQKDRNGNVVGVNAYYLGMKVALFDVTDVANPKELHKVNIGDRGTHSELLHNHKALLFDKEKNLLAFPVDLYEVPAGAQDHYGMPAYGTITYQGAYIYQLDPTNGFQLRGTITHMSEQELAKAGNYWYGDQRIQRILYIGDHLYTLSDAMIKANAMSDLQETGRLTLEAR